MTRVLFIAGHSHSGSTLLEMMLSAHPRVCGLVEVAMLLDPRSRARYLEGGGRHRCSCGEPLDGCPLWSAFLDSLETDPPASYAAGYRRLLAQVRRLRGEEVVVADSSKYLGALARLADGLEPGSPGSPELFVIHLLRDVRGFATSLKRRDRVSGPRALVRSWRRFTAWHRDNLALERLLEAGDLDHMRMGYEELCAAPRRALEAICSRAGLEFEPAMLDPAHASGHIGLGNPMRHRAAGRPGLRYDDRWHRERAIRSLYRLRGGVRRYTESAVYANFRPGGVS